MNSAGSNTTIPLADKGIQLIKELNRKVDGLPAYNSDTVRQVTDEIKCLCDANVQDVPRVGEQRNTAEYQPLYNGIIARHTAIERNKRCLLAYHVNRLDRIKTYRWSSGGSVLPPDVRENVSEAEHGWYQQYNRMLATYMTRLGGDEAGGLDLTKDQQPPKSLLIEVRCLTDYGQFETEQGTTVYLSADSVHSLMSTDCETLIRQGVLEMIN